MVKETITKERILESVSELRNNFRIERTFRFCERGFVKETWEWQRKFDLKKTFILDAVMRIKIAGQNQSPLF